jgi:hypothetical protein
MYHDKAPLERGFERIFFDGGPRFLLLIPWNRALFHYRYPARTQPRPRLTVLHGVMAMTRSGLPEPPTIFNGAAITMAPVGGS